MKREGQKNYALLVFFDTIQFSLQNSDIAKLVKSRLILSVSKIIMIINKIKTRKELSLLCENFRKQQFTIGFTSGAFDLLHAGHVDYLEKTKAYCDVLIIALNSDKSIRRYKGANRPIISQDYRAKTVAALEFVDYVFLFDERRNEKNIKWLKPDFYFKAADYSLEQLTSKSVIEQQGGKVQLIPIKETISTTEIIKKIMSLTSSENKYTEDKSGVGYFDRKPTKISPAIFFDRDGTINKEIGYLSEPEKFEFLPYALKGLKKIQNMGFRLIIVTNQSGIGLGYFTKEDFYNVNIKMLQEMSKFNITIDKIYFCPHSMAENCSCRKPEIALLQRAKEDLNIDLANSYFIGDRVGDIKAGKRAGTRTILIKSNYIGELEVKPDFVANNLVEAADLILEQERRI